MIIFGAFLFCFLLLLLLFFFCFFAMRSFIYYIDHPELAMFIENTQIFPTWEQW